VKLWTAHVVAALLLVSGYAQAEPSSNVAWNAATLKLVGAGDIERGRTLVAICSACHGDGGAGTMRDGPAIAGQHRDYLVATLQSYKNGTRANDVYSRMRVIAASLTDDEIDALAEYFSSTAPPVF
jgi:cytochrome c553